MSDESVTSNNSAMPHLTKSTSILSRLVRSFGPVLPGLILDLADLASLTRFVGPWAGFPIGVAIGIWLSMFYPFHLGWRLVIIIGSGVYAMTPGTEYIPLATILTCLGRFIEGAPERPMTETENQITRNADFTPTDEPVRLVRSVPNRAACPECGSSSLKYGEVAQRFVPTGSSLWAKGHEVNAFVCLECGFVGHYLASSDLEKLRETDDT